MISICIPIYNFNVSPLVEALATQCKLLDVPSEIVLIDDCSDESFKAMNEEVCSRESYFKLSRNIGRAAIRNKFLDYAKFEFLLFLDCDSLVISDSFLQVYISALTKHPDNVICGGRIYPSKAPERSKRLRWKYGIEKESQDFITRNLNPNRSFMTNNFAISKSLFESIKFDENLVKYGHEDTLFGFELKQRNVAIVHIDNPILNGDLENNIDYLNNTEHAILNLNHILVQSGYNAELIDDITLLRVYKKLYPYRSIINLAFWLKGPIVKFLLSKGVANLFFFDFYKLGFVAKNVKLNFIKSN